MRKWNRLFVFLCSALTVLSAAAADIVPAPRVLTAGAGAYEVSVPVLCPKYDWWDCDYRERCLAAAKITHVMDASLPQEGYGLKVAQDGVEI